MGELLILVLGNLLQKNEALLQFLQLLVDGFEVRFGVLQLVLLLLVHLLEDVQYPLGHGLMQVAFQLEAVKHFFVSGVHLPGTSVYLTPDLVALVVEDAFFLYLIAGHVGAAGRATDKVSQRQAVVIFLSGIAAVVLCLDLIDLKKDFLADQLLMLSLHHFAFQ
nr:hypothetical protein [Rufibacter sp. DG15C]